MARFLTVAFPPKNTIRLHREVSRKLKSIGKYWMVNKHWATPKAMAKDNIRKYNRRMNSYTISKGNLNGPSIKSNEEEFEAIRGSKKIVLKMLGAEEKYDLFIENYLEFEETLLTATSRYMVIGSHDDDWFNLTRNTFDRRIFNLISASGAYIDFAEHCAEVLASGRNLILKECNRLYDNYFAYRMMQSFRDYILHRGLLCRFLTYQIKRIPPDLENFALRYRIPELAISGEHLEESKTFRSKSKNKRLLIEIEEKGGKVSLLPLIREYAGHLSEIHVYLRFLCQPKVGSSTNITKGVLARFDTEHPNLEYSGLIARKIEGNKVVEQITFVDTPQRLDDFEEKNRHLPNLERRFVSNDIPLNDSDVDSSPEEW